MKKIISIVFLLSFLINSPFDVTAQNKDLEVLNSIATQYYSVPSKKDPLIWIHLDKNLYTPGANCLFSIYLLNQSNYRLMRNENTVYAELVDEKENSIQYALFNKLAFSLTGSITLPDTLKEGIYRFRAFTKNILERNPEKIAEVLFYVLEPKKATLLPVSAMHRLYKPFNKSSIQFLVSPEGGSIISGINNKIVVSTFDAEGKPLEVNGVFKNSIDSSITRFHTNALGLASFNIVGIKNRKYKTSIQYKGQTYEKEVPAPPTIAWQVSVVQRTKNAIKLRIALSDSLYKINPNSYLLGVSSGKICFAATGTGMYEIDIPISNFPPGITTFQLYDQQKQLVSSRNVFINEETIKIAVTTNQRIYAPRDWVKMNLDITDITGKPLKSRFSISITDDVYLEKVPDDSLLKFRLLLNNWFFDKPVSSEQLLQILQDSISLDLAMIGLEKNAATKTNISTENTLDSLSITGQALTKKNNPLSNHTITFLSNQGGSIVKTATTDKNGKFFFSLPDFFGTTLISLQVSDSNDKVKNDAVIHIQNPEPPKWNNTNFLSFAANTPSIAEINQYKAGYGLYSLNPKKGKLTKEVFIPEESRTQLEIINKKRVNKNSWVATPEMLDQAGEGNVSNVILRAPGVILMSGFVTIQGGIRGVSGAVNAKVEPLIIVDGVQINLGESPDIGLSLNVSPVLNFLNTFSARNIDFIEVLSGSQGAQYGTVGGNGVILLFTNSNPRTGLTNKDYSSGMHPLFIKGYHLPEPFIGPDYSEKQSRSKYSSDNRTTLYWDGEAGTDSTGKATIRFYCSDHSGSYTVTLRGLTESGTIFTRSRRINTPAKRPE